MVVWLQAAQSCRWHRLSPLRRKHSSKLYNIFWLHEVAVSGIAIIRKRTISIQYGNMMERLADCFLSWGTPASAPLVLCGKESAVSVRAYVHRYLRGECRNAADPIKQ